MYAVLVLAALIYIASAVNLAVRKGLKGFVRTLCTPAFLLFCILYISLIVFNHGKLASGWDEFSYWMDSVKFMSIADDFVANPASNSLFRSYPPALGLFQYFIQKLYQLFDPGVFCEWWMYTAYQLFGLSLLFPFLSTLEWKTPWKNICVFLTIVLIPIFLFGEFYTSIYIDPMVGLLVGASFAYLFVNGFHSLKDAVYIGLTGFTLVLAKDVGKFFIVILLLSVLCVLIAEDVRKHRTSKTIPVEKKRYVFFLIAAGSAVLAYVLWQIMLKKYDAPVRFGNKIEIVDYLRMLLFHTDTTYRQEVADKARTAIFENQISLKPLGTNISYFVLLVLAGLLLIVLYRRRKSRELSYSNDKLCTGIALAGVFLQAVLYSIFIGAVYIANFSESEALNLASYTRYMNMAFLPLWIVILLGFFHTDRPDQGRNAGTLTCTVVLSVVLLVSPMQNISAFLHGDNIREAAIYRQNYEEMATTIDQTCTENDRIYLVSQANNGKDYWVLKYRVRPNCILLPGHWGWSVGSGPLYEGDAWTKVMTASEFRQLLQEQYDYLAVYRSDPSFETNYGELFRDEIKMNSLYKVNKDTGELTLWQ